jgi:hypothetical protein
MTSALHRVLEFLARVLEFHPFDVNRLLFVWCSKTIPVQQIVLGRVSMSDVCSHHPGDA